MDIKIDKTMQTTILEPIQNGITNKTSWTSELEDINTIEKELDLLMNQYEQLSTPLLLEKFDSIKKNISHWMEQAHLTVFKLEQQLKDGIPVMINNDNNHEFSFMMMDRMDTLMSNLLDMNDIIVNEKLNDQYEDEESETSTKMAFKMTITKTQSEWSGLQHFISSVSKKIESVNEKRELLIMMENILLEIDQLTSIIFKYQEKRQYDLIPPSSPSAIESTATTGDINEATLMADIDRRVDPVFLLVEKLYGRMTSSRPPYDESGILVKKHRKVQEKWECLRIEIDELKDDLKEDRWLAVFKQVADQVDPMIDGLDKTVQQCYQAIHQIIEWHDLVQQYQQQLQQQHHNTGLQSPHSPSAFDKITKTFLRSFPKSSHHSSSVSSTSSSSVSTSTLPPPPPPPPPMDREKFKAMEKNFEAKYKYYTPSIDRMLNMLGNGIASRVNKDTSTCKRHTTMVNRWQQLKTMMDDLRIHDMVDAERYLIETPLSPANSMQSDRSSHGMWKSIRRRTSEQDTNSEYSYNSNNSSRKKGPSTASSQYDDFRRVRSVTPSSGNYIYTSNNRQRTASPMNLSQQHYNHQHFSHYNSNNSNRIIRPSTSDTSSVESTSPKQRPYITGRKSLTPNSHRPAWNANIKSDKQEFSTLEPLWKTESRAAASSSSFITNNNNDPTSSPPQNKKSHIPRPPSRQQQTSKEASFMKPTKSTLLRKRSQSVEPRDMMRPKTPVKSLGKSSHQHNSNNTLQTPTIVTSGGRRTKTPLTTSTQSPYQLPPRPKSSLARQETHDTLPYIDRERINGSKSPLLTTHRSNTPSLIPRPKTPTSNGKDYLRSSSPSLIPRPRSALRYYQQQQQDDDDDRDYEGNYIPPVPPLPSNLERPSIHLLKVGKLNKQDIYSDVSDDDNDNDEHDNYVTPGSFLSVPPLFDSNNRSQSPSQEKHYYHSNNNNNNNNINNYHSHTNNNQQLQQQQQQLKKQQQKRELLKKRSMPALAMRRSNSPSSFTNNNNSNHLNYNNNNSITITQSPLSSSTNGRRRKNRVGYFSEDEDEETYYHQHNNNNDHELTRGVKIAFQEHPIYTGDPRDPLDMEVATILNASPISIQCQKSPKGDGKYYFGNELNPTLGGGKKLYTCKLINYSDRPPRRQTSSSSTTTTKQHQPLVRNKVLVRVGGGWQDLEMFLLEHASLMTSDVVVRSFIH